MSVCTFIASNCPLYEVKPSKEYPLMINVDSGSIFDEVWHVWLNGGYYEYDERSIIYRKTLHFREVVPEDIREVYNAEIWENANSIRPIHYCLKILKG